MKINAKKILLIFSIIFIMMFPNFLAPTIAMDSSKKIGIIVVPGVLGSGIFHTARENFEFYENEVVYAVFESDDKARSTKSWAKLLLEFPKLYMDENGNPVDKNFGLPNSDSFPSKIDSEVYKYGVRKTYKKLIDSLSDNFKSGITKKIKDFFISGSLDSTILEYEVCFVNNDWRRDDSFSADMLLQKIKDYEKVVIIAHSNGGLISCKAMSKLYKEGQIDKVAGYISIAVPYTGSAKSLEILELGNILENYSFVAERGMLNIYTRYAKAFVRNLIPSWQLLPNEYYPVSFLQDEKGNDLNYTKSLELLNKRNWNKKQDGSYKKNFKIASVFMEDLFVDGKHITNFVDSFFFVGTGYQTLSKVQIDRNKSDNCKNVEFADGDDTVCLFAAIPPKWEKFDKVNYFKSSHVELAEDSEVIQRIIETIKEIEF